MVFRRNGGDNVISADKAARQSENRLPRRFYISFLLICIKSITEICGVAVIRFPYSWNWPREVDFLTMMLNN